MTSRSSAWGCTRGASGAATSWSTAWSRRVPRWPTRVSSGPACSSSPAATPCATGTPATSRGPRSPRRSGGAARAVHPALLETLLGQGRVPVIASICDCDGALLNVNADDLAAALAGALHARALVLLSDAPGLRLGGSIVPRLDADSLAAALDHPDVQGGMRPKLIAARAALDAGVPRAHIAAWSGPGTLRTLIGGGGAGTTILATADALLSHRSHS